MVSRFARCRPSDGDETFEDRDAVLALEFRVPKQYPACLGANACLIEDAPNIELETVCNSRVEADRDTIARLVPQIVVGEAWFPAGACRWHARILGYAVRTKS